MAMARARLVDPSVTRWYHCVTRCVRPTFLLDQGPNDRKAWIHGRLQVLADIWLGRDGSRAVAGNYCRTGSVSLSAAGLRIA
jgi:hypothetical protein